MKTCFGSDLERRSIFLMWDSSTTLRQHGSIFAALKMRVCRSRSIRATAPPLLSKVQSEDFAWTFHCEPWNGPSPWFEATFSLSTEAAMRIRRLSRSGKRRPLHCTHTPRYSPTQWSGINGMLRFTDMVSDLPSSVGVSDLCGQRHGCRGPVSSSDSVQQSMFDGVLDRQLPVGTLVGQLWDAATV